MSKITTERKKPTVFQAILPIAFMIVSLAIGYGYFKMKIEPIMVISAFFAGIIALRLGYTWEEMQKAIIDKISSALPATLILWSVGFLIGSLMFSGTVPMIIYYGIQFISPKFILSIGARDDDEIAPCPGRCRNLRRHVVGVGEFLVVEVAALLGEQLVQ